MEDSKDVVADEDAPPKRRRGRKRRRARLSMAESSKRLEFVPDIELVANFK